MPAGRRPALHAPWTNEGGSRAATPRRVDRLPAATPHRAARTGWRRNGPLGSRPARVEAVTRPNGGVYHCRISVHSLPHFCSLTGRRAGLQCTRQRHAKGRGRGRGRQEEGSEGEGERGWVCSERCFVQMRGGAMSGDGARHRPRGVVPSHSAPHTLGGATESVGKPRPAQARMPPSMTKMSSAASPKPWARG